jgi:predicted RNA-binding protein (TIGR00451 family)
VQFLENDLERIRSVADYQFGRGVGKALFPKQVEIIRSRRTGRIRYVYLDDKRLVTMRPTDGLFSLSIAGAKRIAERSTECLVMAKNGVSEFVAGGSDVFAVHVVEADNEIRARDEVIVIDESREVLAVGRALLSGEEMKAFKRGVAVKTRRGTQEG